MAKADQQSNFQIVSNCRFNLLIIFHLIFLRNLTVESLHYLSSEQALADLANFIQSKNTEYKFSDDTKWIAFGGSYPGSLAAWLREKYPRIVHGSISTSGPLLAQADFYGMNFNVLIAVIFV